jgi:hypothetical protein
MKPSIRQMALLLSATAIVATIGLAPVATASTGTPNGTHSVGQNAAPVKPPPFGVGVDPLVLTDTGADPLVLMPQGYGLPF